MASFEERIWEPDFAGLTRRDRRPCRYSVYLPNLLTERRFAFDGDVAADVADAEADLVRLNGAVDAFSARIVDAGQGVREIERSLEQWQLGIKDLRRRMILAPTPRERERWYAILLLVQGLTAAATAEALERDPHTIGRWASAFGEGGPAGLMFEQTGGSPPALDEAQQEDLKRAVPESPATSGMELANWYWKGVRQFVGERFGVELSRSSCLNWLHRLGFSCKRPKQRLVKANGSKREAFVAEYAALREAAPEGGGPRERRENILCRRGALPGGRGTEGQMGAPGRTGPGGLDQPAVRREGQLLFGGVLGDGRGGMDGTGGEQ